MVTSKRMEEHSQLMDQMADRLNADLDEAELRGDLTPDMRHAMVLSCTNCTSPEDCKKWLATHDSADAAPEFCRNGEKLKGLQDG